VKTVIAVQSKMAVVLTRLPATGGLAAGPDPLRHRPGRNPAGHRVSRHGM